MIILTVYTLYLDDNFWNKVCTNGQTYFGPKMFIMVPKWKFERRSVETFERICRSLTSKIDQKWSFWQSIHCISMTILWKKVRKDYFFGPNHIHNTVPKWKFKGNSEAMRKFYILQSLASKMIILTVYTLYLDRQFLEIRSVMGELILVLRLFIMVPKWKFKDNSEAYEKILYFANFDFKNDHFDSLYTVSR